MSGRTVQYGVSGHKPNKGPNDGNNAGGNGNGGPGGGMMGMMGTIMMARLSHLHRQCPKPIRRKRRRRRQAVMEEGEVMTLTKIPMTVMKSLFGV